MIGRRGWLRCKRQQKYWGLGQWFSFQDLILFGRCHKLHLMFGWLSSYTKKGMIKELFFLSSKFYNLFSVLLSCFLWWCFLCFCYRIPECGLLMQSIEELAVRYPSTKFVKIISTDCIPNYPDRNLPTLLVYNNGAVKGNYVGLHSFGRRCTPEGIYVSECKLHCFCSLTLICATF